MEGHGRDQDTSQESLQLDRWAQTSFKDATEAAVHYALINFTLAMEARRAGRQGSVWPDESDIFIAYRRLIRDLIDGTKNPEAYLEEQS